ncbi:MAG TPA: HEAT repeat domain-containing protein [Blastocatellia bacterium]|nr:HEAT repeat domain-containing protein [Blastocatellia bacterium]
MDTRILGALSLVITLACVISTKGESFARELPVPSGPIDRNAGTLAQKAGESGQSDAALKARLGPVLSLRADSPDDDFKKALASDDWYVRGEAALAAARLKKKLPGEQLTSLLDDKNWFVRCAALDALAVSGDSSAGAAVEKMLDSPDPYLCAKAAAVIGDLKYEAGTESLSRLLAAENPIVKREAAISLGKLRAARSTGSLIGMLKDESPEVRSAAAQALGEIGDAQAAAPIDAAFNDAGEAAWVYAIALYRLGNHAHLDAILASLKSPDDEERLAALAAVVEFKDPASAAALVELYRADPPSPAISENDVEFRVGMAKAFGEFSDSSSGSALISMLQDPRPAIRAAAVEAISHRVAANNNSSAKSGMTAGSVSSSDKAFDQTAVAAIILLLKNEPSPLVLAAIDHSMKSFDRDQTIDALLASLKSGANVRQMLTDMGVTAEAEGAKLANGTLDEKMRAVDILGRLGDPSAIEPLMKTLAATKEPGLKAQVVQTLGEFKDRNTEDALLDASRDPQAEVRAAAVSALGRLGDSSVTGTLFDATRDSSEDVRDAAFRSLGLMGISVERLSADVTNANWQARITAVATLARLHDSRAVPVVITALKDSDERVRAESARALAVLADNRAVEPLLGALADQSPEVRFQAAAGLGIFKDRRSIQPLESALTDRDSRVSAAAAESLARLQDPGVIRMLIRTLGSGDWQLRARAAQVLMRVPGAAASPEAIPRLVDGLRDKDLIVRYYSAEALVSAGAPAVPQLAELFRSGKFIERERTGRVLGRIGRPSISPMSDIIQDRTNTPELRAAAAAVLGIVGDPQGIEPLVSLLGDQRYFVREQAAIALGRIGAPAIDQLVKLSHASGPATRESAVEALGDACAEIRHEIEQRGQAKPGDEALIARCVETIQHALTDPNASIKLAAVRAMGSTGSKDAVEPLMAILRDDQSTVRSEAAVALGKLGQPALKPLTAALSDAAPLTRKLAAQALGDVQSKEAVPQLIQLVRSDVSGARGEAIEALGKIGDPQAVDAIIAAMQGASSSVKLQAIQALALLRGPRVEGVFIRTLGDQDEQVRQAAAAGLADVGTEAAVPALEKIADDDPNSEVRSAAVAAISRLKAKH